MQGSYKSNGLPRPYNMKPMRTKRHSPYDSASHNYFNSPRRKLMGYVVMLALFCVGIYWLGQSMRPPPETGYEVVGDTDKPGLDVNRNIDHIVGGSSNDKEEDIVLAGNMAKNSKGDMGIGVAEAPKGGMANEAPVVGNDEGEIIDGRKKPGRAGVQAPLDIKDEHDPDEDYV